MLRSLAESLTLVAMIFKLQAEAQDRGSESMKEWFKHLSLNDELQQKLRDQIAGVIVVTDEQTEAMDDAAEAAAAYDDVLRRLAERDLAKNIKEAITAFEEFEGVEESLALAFEQDMIGMEEKTQEFVSNLIMSLGGWAEGHEVIVERVKTANELLIESWNLTNEAQLAFAQTAISEFVNMEASLKGFVGAILGTLESWAIGELIPRIMKALPFPANLLAVGGAVLFIKSWFAALRPKEPEGKAGGGWVGLHGEEVIKVGERGPEYITKTSDIRNFYDQRARKIDITIIVKDQLDPYSAQKITRQQIIPQILESLDINENKRAWQEKLE